MSEETNREPLEVVGNDNDRDNFTSFICPNCGNKHPLREIEDGEIECRESVKGINIELTAVPVEG